MVNYLKWGLVAALIAGVVIFRDQIKGALTSAGQTLGEGVGGAAGGFVTGAVTGLTKPFAPGSYTYEESRKNLPKGFPGLFDLFGIPQSAYGQTPPASQTQDDPIRSRDLAGDPSITPYNRETMSAIEQEAAKRRIGHPQYVSPAQIKTAYRQVLKENPSAPIATRVALANQKAGAPSDLQIFYQLKAQGYSQTEAARRMRQLVGTRS